MMGEYEGYDDQARRWAKPKLSPKQWDEVKRRYLEGETASALASEFGISAASVRGKVGRR